MLSKEWLVVKSFAETLSVCGAIGILGCWASGFVFNSRVWPPILFFAANAFCWPGVLLGLAYDWRVRQIQPARLVYAAIMAILIAVTSPLIFEQLALSR